MNMDRQIHREYSPEKLSHAGSMVSCYHGGRAGVR